MSHARMETKVRGYVAYHLQEPYMRRYGAMKFFQVVTITETRDRAERLKKQTSFGSFR